MQRKNAQQRSAVWCRVRDLPAAYLAQVVLFILAVLSTYTFGQEALSKRSSGPAVEGVTTSGGASRGMITSRPRPVTVKWRHLLLDSAKFLAIEHAFRCATEAGTRDAFGNSFVGGYLSSVGNLHGWSDGDPFYVNYVGHPMQGAVASFIWSDNDPSYRAEPLSRSARYWKAKLRGLAFSYVYSVQFEIGPVSEASIGNIQKYYPQQGFVDHIITPTIGTLWVLAEDAIDLHVVRWVEGHTRSPWARLMVRAGLNPARSMANVVHGSVPWHRTTRAGVLTYNPETDVPALPATRQSSIMETRSRGVDNIDIGARSFARTYFGSNAAGPCVGGEGTAAVRVASRWQAVLNVGGCKTLGLRNNVSSDSLDYMGGVRWTPAPKPRWTVDLQFLAGGTKTRWEHIYPDRKRAAVATALQRKTPLDPAQFSDVAEANNPSVRAGVGVSVILNRALSLRVAQIDYAHVWGDTPLAAARRNSIQSTCGLTLRIGDW